VEKSEAARRVKSADRALALVELVAARGAIGFGDVLTELGLPRSSASGLLRTLVAAGWLEHDPLARQYSLGLRAWQVGLAYGGHRDLAAVARPVMDRLSAETGETVQLARLDGVENVYVAISESANPMRLASRVGMRLPAHATGIGKALLSLLPPDEATRRIRSTGLPRLTDRTVTDPDALLGVLERVRAEGFAIDDEEFVSGCRCVAVPLPGVGEVPAAVSITMPTSRTDAAWPRSVLAPLRAAADEIAETLGSLDTGGSGAN
jgi:DNA-binding IclR family transcriptional regulator